MAELGTVKTEVVDTSYLRGKVFSDLFAALRSAGFKSVTPQGKVAIRKKLTKFASDLDDNLMVAGKEIVDEYSGTIQSARKFQNAEGKTYDLSEGGTLRKAVASTVGPVKDEAGNIAYGFGHIDLMDSMTQTRDGLGYWRYHEFGAGARTLEYSTERGGYSNRFRPVRIGPPGSSDWRMIPVVNPEEGRRYHPGVSPTRPIRSTVAFLKPRRIEILHNALIKAKESNKLP